MVETLQLFPINPFGESETESFRLLANDHHYKETTSFPYAMDHPPLDLRLSFL